jgi:SAM-dependent methyltransferase
MAADHADRIIGLYDRHASAFDKERWKGLFEKAWLDRFLALVPRGGNILDLGCGSGEPIARYFIETGYTLTGVDSSQSMIALCQRRFSGERWMVADMRSLSLSERFDGVLAWNSFFHLCAEDQRKMFRVFSQHTLPDAPLMFTSGPRHGIAMGEFHGEPLYHASLDPLEYRVLLGENGFRVVSQIFDDPDCGRHSVWLAQKKDAASAGNAA